MFEWITPAPFICLFQRGKNAQYFPKKYENVYSCWWTQCRNVKLSKSHFDKTLKNVIKEKTCHQIGDTTEAKKGHYTMFF